MQRLHGWIGRKDRHSVEIDAIVQRTDGSERPVRLSDLSNEGCRIDTESSLRIGERLHIAIPHVGHVSAQVRWALPGSAGVRFLDQIKQ